MNTNALERFAKLTRIKLLDQVGRKLEYVTKNTDEVFLATNSTQINSLKEKIDAFGEKQVIESVSYTWFNRLMALRFMDANGYNIPKVVSSAIGKTPEILQNALAGQVDDILSLNRQRLNNLLDGKVVVADNQTDAYKILLIASCNYWHNSMPFMFERISDYTELLLPDDLLSDYSIISDIRDGMSDEDCLHEEILGWLYQFYISDENERLIKSKKVYSKNELAPASQLFTPKWIVQYMVDNTLGQLWSEINPSTTILDKLEFYIKPAYKTNLQPRPKKKLEEIKFFEPCVGSAHILSYAFDVFYLMYEEQGYNTSEIPELILKYNLFGADIDERSAQIASFVLMMKGRRKNSRFLRKNITPNISFYQDFENDPKFNNATIFGSLIKISPKEINSIKIEEGSVFAENQKELKKLYTLLGQRYDCVVTNPPYISSARMEVSLKKYVEENYPNTKSDLFATFITKCIEQCNEDGLTGYMTPFVWMFISSYEKLRKCIIEKHFINNLVQLEYSGFEGATVPICTFTLRNKPLVEAKGSYIRLNDFKGPALQAPKTLEAITNPQCGWFYIFNQSYFLSIPESPISYWIPFKLIQSFKNEKRLGDLCEIKAGLQTGNTSMFLRLWHEVSLSKTTLTKGVKWFPIQKGGSFRRWFGNQEYLVNWEDNGKEIHDYNNVPYDYNGAPVRAKRYYFKEGLSYNLITSGKFSIRFYPINSIFDIASPSIFAEKKILYSLLLFLNTKVVEFIVKALNPTLNTSPGILDRIPIFEHSLTEGNASNLIELSKSEWDSHETSWDFQQNELVKQQCLSLIVAFEAYKVSWSKIFYELHHNEEELNRKYIEIFGLQDELNPYVPLEEITILHEEARIVNNCLTIDPVPVLQQLISYSIGCLFGRFTLDKPGLILANEGETLQSFFHQVPNPVFIPDEDNIIPVLESEWFADDIVGRFNSFLKVAFGEKHFDENLSFIENTIGKDIRKYFVKDFYNDHIKRYKKRPIYWMFSSPKGHFKVLIYMHRYQPDLCSKILNDYLQAFINKLEAAAQSQTMFSLREDISGREKSAAQKEIDRLNAMVKDCREYAQILYTVATKKIAIDLDDGVKVNYQKFKDVLVPIKGLEKEEE